MPDKTRENLGREAIRNYTPWSSRLVVGRKLWKRIALCVQGNEEGRVHSESRWAINKLGNIVSSDSLGLVFFSVASHVHNDKHHFSVGT